MATGAPTDFFSWAQQIFNQAQGGGGLNGGTGGTGQDGNGANGSVPKWEDFLNFWKQQTGQNDPMPVGQSQPIQSVPDAYNLTQITNPQLPPGAVYNPQMQTPKPGELLDSNNYKVDPNAYAVQAAQGNTQQAQTPTQKDAATIDPSLVDPNSNQMDAQQGQVSSNAQVNAAQGELNPEIKDLLKGYMNFDENLDPRALVQNQYAKLTDFDPDHPPSWAIGAIRTAQQTMAARGLGSSSMMGSAVTGAVLQAALPIAQQDASVFAAIHMKKMDQKQAATFLQAGYLAQMDQANLNNRQQAAVQNAQNFLAMDLQNLNNRQQAAVINTQARTQAMLSNQAAENAAKQFNATSINQVNQFYDSLSASISQFNASQSNAMEQFNVDQKNTLATFNAQMQSQRDSFNAQNAIVIDQANAEWLRNINTANTAAINQANMVNAQKMFDVSATALANELQKSRDIMNYAFTAWQNGLNRMQNMRLAKMQNDQFYDQLNASEQSSFFSALGGIAGGIVGNWDEIFG